MSELEEKLANAIATAMFNIKNGQPALTELALLAEEVAYNLEDENPEFEIARFLDLCATGLTPNWKESPAA